MFRLTFTDGESEWILDPDHPNHQANMNSLKPMARAILRAYLDEVRNTLDISKIQNPSRSTQ